MSTEGLIFVFFDVTSMTNARMRTYRTKTHV